MGTSHISRLSYRRLHNMLYFAEIRIYAATIAYLPQLLFGAERICAIRIDFEAAASRRRFHYDIYAYQRNAEQAV